MAKKTRTETVYTHRRELVTEWRVCENLGPIPGYVTVRNPRDLQAYLEPLARGIVESVWLLHLDVRMKLVGHSVISQGTLWSSHAAPIEVARAAVLAGSAACILAHNHPSGQTDPSPDDVEATKRVSAACATIEIPLLDHLIVALNPEEGRVDIRSLKEAGMMA